MSSSQAETTTSGVSTEARTACHDKILGLLQRIEESELNAFITVDNEGALKQADVYDLTENSDGLAGPLQGMAVAIKDLIDVAGLRTTMGSEQYKDNVAQHDAPVVQALRKAGGVILGKTNTHEFAYGSTGDRSFFGPVKNPNNPAHVSGGSSSGSAAAVAAGLCEAALGTDTSASVRLPAALCGVVGIKPTYDLLPRKGVFNLSQTLDHVGVITKTVADNARVLAVMTSELMPEHTNFSDKLDNGVKGMRIGVVPRFYGEYLSPEVQAAFDRSQASLISAGATIAEVDIPEIMDIYNNQQIVLKYEALANHKDALSQGKPYCDEVRDRLHGGEDITVEQYEQAKACQSKAKAAFDLALTDLDIILTPTCGILAPRINERHTLVNGNEYSTFWLLTRHTAPTNFSGHPSLSVPFGKANGLPIGMQLIGRFYDEVTLYQVAQVLEHGNLKIIN